MDVIAHLMLLCSHLIEPSTRGRELLRTFIVCISVLAAALVCTSCDNGGSSAGCPATQSQCGVECVDTDSDPNHCGECDNACSAGEVCNGAGSCDISCQADLTECDGTCVNTQTDVNHCGGCDAACASGEVCSAGTCATSCQAGLLQCGNTCINPEIDLTYCGASGDCTGANAGVTCGTDEACVDGACLELDPCAVATGGGEGVTITTQSSTAIEGGAAVTYTVVLDSEPCDYVIIALAGDAQATVAPVMLTFLPMDWNIPQAISVTAVHDFDSEGAHTSTISHTATSHDSGYEALPIANAVIDIEDRAHLTHVSIPLVGAGGDGDSRAPVVDSTGTMVAFESSATNLDVGDSGAFLDVFLRRLALGSTTRISSGLAGEADGASNGLSISSDGNKVVFRSAASNLVTDTITTSGEIYLFEQSTGMTSLVSALCAGACNNELGTAAISGDGSYVAYSTRRRLLASDAEGEYDVFVLDLVGSTLTHDSLNSADANGSFYWGSNAFGPTLSATGQFVGFNSAARNLDTPDITVQNFHAYVKDRTSRALTRVSRHTGGTDNCDGAYHAGGSSAPRISADGNLAAFSSACAFTLDASAVPDTNGVGDVFLRDIAAQTTTRVSVSSAGDEGDGSSSLVAMSDDGRYILFMSDATNLVPGDTNGAKDLFLHDTLNSTTIRINTDARFEELAEGVDSAGMSRNGDFVVFATAADILPSDSNGNLLDVYLIQLR